MYPSKSNGIEEEPSLDLGIGAQVTSESKDFGCLK